MSSGGQILGGIVGAVAGFYVGGPAGALQGAALGAGIGGYLDPPKGPTVEGPRLNDLKVQTSTYGAIIPHTYATIALSGNVMWLENNQLKETVKKKKQGGKGGGSSSTLKTYSYSATFALGLCEGPIAGVRRIWCGDKLIYNAGSSDLETIIASNAAAENFRIYLGTDDQLPDARYEANVGVGNAPAFRGLAYIVFYDFQLADYGNSLQGAQFKVEVAKLSEQAAPEAEIVTDYPLTVGNSGLRIPSRFTSEYGSVIQPDVSSQQYCEYKIKPGGYTLEPTGVPYNTSSPYKWYRAQWAVGLSDNAYSNFSGSLLYCDGDEIVTPISGYSDEIIVRFVDGRYLLQKVRFPDTLYIHRHKAIPDQASDWITRSLSGYSAFACYGELIYGMNSTASDIVVLDSALNTVGTISLSNSEVSSLSRAISIFADRIFTIYQGSCKEFTMDGELVKTYSLPISVSSALDPFPFVVADGIAAYYSALSRVVHVSLGSISTQSESVASVVATEIESSRLLTSSDVDVSLLSSYVRGYKIAGGTIRSALEPLQGAFPFDVRQHGYQLQCVPRGQLSAITVPSEDLGASDSEPDQSISFTREMDSQLPAKTVIKYIDAEREYATSEQYKDRTGTTAVNRVDRDLPIVLTANEAARVADVLQTLPWMERSEYQLKLPPTYLQLEPGDVITVPTPEATYEFRLTEINETPDFRMEAKARPNRAAIYNSVAVGGEAPGPDGEIGLSGDSLVVPLDIPVVDGDEQNAYGFVAAMTGRKAGWNGAILARSFDSGQTWSEIAGFTGKATIGRARGKLNSSTCIFIDASSITIDMISGELESISRDSMLAGQNYAAYGDGGRWEIVRFQDASLQPDGSYICSGFVRGEFGTEWAVATHQAGDWFVWLGDVDLAFVGSPSSSIGVSATLRAVTNGADIISAKDVPFTYSAVNLRCLSPVYAKGRRDGSSNFTATFTRRSRLQGSWWSAGVEAAIAEQSEAYEIDVMSSGIVKRTITSATPSFSYSAANQVTDFGSTQSSITFRIYQISAATGRGYSLEVTM